MKILVTGTAGFIGFHLAKKHLERGDEVVGIDNINDYYDVNLKYARLTELGINVENNDFKWKEKVDSKKLYGYILQEVIKRLNQECKSNNDEFMIIIDEQENNAKKKHGSMRAKIVEASAMAMFAGHNGKCLIEPPIQAESHLYQNLQCADWICGLIGRLAYYDLEPDNNNDLKWVDKYFRDRITKVSRRSSIRRP